MPQVLQKPNSAPTPKAPAEYQAEAMAALIAADKGNQTQTTTPPAEAGADQAKTGKADGGSTEVQPEQKDPSAAKPDEKKDDLPPNIKAAFEKLTAEKAAFRKDKETLTAQVKEANDRAAKAEALVSAKTPMELLRARGFTWKDAVEEMTGVRPEGEEQSEKPVKEEPAKKLSLADIDPEAAKDLAEWKADRQKKQRDEGRSTVRKGMEEFAKKGGEKFKFIAALGEFDEAMDFIDRHFDKYKELPGSTFEETVEIALAHVEEKLRGQAAKWKGVLTPGSEGDTQDPAEETRESAAPKQAASDEAGSKTLTHSQAGAPRTGPNKEPQTPEEYRAAALAELLKRDKR